MPKKNTSGISALQKMNTTIADTEKKTTPDEAPTAAVEPKKPVKAEEPKEKRKSGRPPIDPSGKKKKDYTKTVNIAIPLDILEKVNVAKVCYNNNITTYINKLIEKDIEANYDNYTHLADSLNSFK